MSTLHAALTALADKWEEHGGAAHPEAIAELRALGAEHATTSEPVAADYTCPTRCVEQNHPGIEHDAWLSSQREHHPKCYQSTGAIPDDLPPDLCDCRVLRMIDEHAATSAAGAGSAPTSEPTLTDAEREDYYPKLVAAVALDSSGYTGRPDETAALVRHLLATRDQAIGDISGLLAAYGDAEGATIDYEFLVSQLRAVVDRAEGTGAKLAALEVAAVEAERDQWQRLAESRRREEHIQRPEALEIAALRQQVDDLRDVVDRLRHEVGYAIRTRDEWESNAEDAEARAEAAEQAVAALTQDRDNASREVHRLNGVKNTQAQVIERLEAELADREDR